MLGAVMWSVQDDYIIFENLGRKYFFLTCKARAAQLKFFCICIFHDYLSLNIVEALLLGFCLISSHSDYSPKTSQRTSHSALFYHQ